MTYYHVKRPRHTCPRQSPGLALRGPEKSYLETSDESLRDELLEKLVEQKLMGPTRQICEGNPDNLPPRELPHGNLANLYLMFVAYCKVMSVEAACKSTFYQVGKKWLSTCLKFHKKSVHAVCQTCTKLRDSIRQATDFAEHARLCDLLLGHYTQQWRDREVYWLARDRSQAQKDLLCIIVDSYDKAKVALPKFPGGRTPKKHCMKIPDVSRHI